jgi:hypothetical protein
MDLEIKSDIWRDYPYKETLCIAGIFRKENHPYIGQVFLPLHLFIQSCRNVRLGLRNSLTNEYFEILKMKATECRVEK